MVIDILLVISMVIAVSGGILWVYNLLKPMNFGRDIAEAITTLVTMLMAYWPMTLVCLTVLILSIWNMN